MDLKVNFNWIGMNQDRIQWRNFVNTVMKIVSLKDSEFIDLLNKHTLNKEHNEFTVQLVTCLGPLSHLVSFLEGQGEDAPV
jgi:hypothetical protein